MNPLCQEVFKFVIQPKNLSLTFYLSLVTLFFHFIPVTLFLIGNTTSKAERI